MEQLIQALASAAQTAAGVTGEQLGVSLPSLFEQPEDSAVGDLALPCFRLAKALRKSPAVIAADLAETIVLPDGVARAEAVNGYLNFFVDPAYYAGRVGAILQNPDFGTRHQGAGKTMVIDYSSPSAFMSAIWGRPSSATPSKTCTPSAATAAWASITSATGERSSAS